MNKGTSISIWSEAQDRFLIKTFGRLTITRISKMLGKCNSTVERRAGKLGLNVEAEKHKKVHHVCVFNPEGYWMLDLRNRRNNSTFALISMCIKDDMEQSLAELAKRVARYKAVPVEIALEKLMQLREQRKLFYYRDVDHVKIKWEPKDGRVSK